MILTIHKKIQSLLQCYASGRYYPVVTGIVACGCAIGAIPFVPVLIAAVLLAPSHWRSIALFTSMGSALGGLIILFVFHNLGWVQVMQAHPDWFTSPGWQLMLSWLTQWGIWALALIAATALPQTPALLFLAMTEQPWWSMWLALAGGKILKYGSVAYLTRYFPERIAHYRQNRFNQQNAITNRDLSP